MLNPRIEPNTDGNIRRKLVWDAAPYQGYRIYIDGVPKTRTWKIGVSEVSLGKLDSSSPSRVYRVSPMDELGVVGPGEEVIWPALPPQPPPPTEGKLKWKPPGWNGSDPRLATSFPGYTVVNITGPGVYNLSSGIDYFLKIAPGGVSWSNGNSRDSVNIAGGRNRVIVGGSIIGASTSTTSDHVALLIDDGDVGGITHLEGLYLESVNGITLRTKQTVQIEYCHIVARAYQDNHSAAHPDLIQIWDRGPCKIRQDWFTGYSGYTGLTCLLGPDPSSWERNNTNIRWLDKQGDAEATVAVYHTAGSVGQAGGPYCTYTSENLWIQPGNYNASTKRKLDDVLCLKHLVGGLNIFPYDIYNASGALLYASPASPTGGNSPVSIGAGVGNYLVLRQNEYLGQRWYYGTPPTTQGADANGDFVPAGSVGNNYAPRGYV